VGALDRERDCSDVFARAMECGKSLAQPPQRGKKTWESEQGRRSRQDDVSAAFHTERWSGWLGREACDNLDFVMIPDLAWHWRC
jgi:hypothetical protein